MTLLACLEYEGTVPAVIQLENVPRITSRCHKVCYLRIVNPHDLVKIFLPFRLILKHLLFIYSG